jgi:hypothetical protein
MKGGNTYEMSTKVNQYVRVTNGNVTVQTVVIVKPAIESVAPSRRYILDSARFWSKDSAVQGFRVLASQEVKRLHICVWLGCVGIF